MRCGLEVLVNERIGLVRGRKVALLCNPAAVDRQLNHALELLLAAGVQVEALWGPEHGVSAAAQDMVSVDSRSQGNPVGGARRVPVHSLYGATGDSLSPRAEWLTAVDAVIIDLQDVGARYYTYVWSMLLTVKACAAAGVDVVVLDRPNPLGGILVEGPSIVPGFESFVGLHAIPVRHGMTCGELALMLCDELKIGVSLEVVGLDGWARSMHFDETGLPWVLPSPNMATLDTAMVYPGACLLEGTNVSEGRGTTRPFEISGAPWANGRLLAGSLADADLPGVRARPLSFIPTFQKHQGTACEGIQLHVADRHTFRPFRTGVALLAMFRRLWPERFAWRTEPYEFVADRLAIDLLAGGPWLREGIDDGHGVADLLGSCHGSEQEFLARRRQYLLYA